MFKIGNPSIRRLFLVYTSGYLLIILAVLGWSLNSLYKQEKEAVYRRMALRLQLAGELLSEEVYQVSQNLRILQTAFVLLEKERPKDLLTAFSAFTVKTLAPRDIQYNAYFALDRKLALELFQKPGYVITTHRDPKTYGTPAFSLESTFISEIFTDPSYQSNSSEVWYHAAKKSQNVEFTGAYFDTTYMKEWLISGSLGVYQNSEFVGMVGVDLLVDEINRRLANVANDVEGLEVLFLDEKDGVVLTPRTDRSIELISDQGQYMPMQFETPGDREKFEAILKSEAKKISLYWGPTGVPFLVSQIKIPNTSWRLISYQKISDIFLMVQETIYLGSLVFFVTLVALIMGWRHLIRRVLNPLEELKLSLFKTLQANWRDERQTSLDELKKPLNYEELSSLKRLVRVLVLVSQRNQERHYRNMEKAQLQSIHSSKMASLGQMAGGIAHEINNPLSIIVGRLSQLEKLIQTDPLDKEKSLEMIQAAEKTVFRIAKIIRALRNFSREASSDPFEKIFVADLVQESLELCEQRMSHSKIRIQVLPIPQDLVVECQSVPISQVMINILNNAFDAIQGLEEKWIQIEVRSAGPSRAQIRISDSGKGISHELASKIMDPFFTTKQVGDGVGLGLSISKGIIETHHGRIFLDETEKHTTFVVELPRFQEPFV